MPTARPEDVARPEDAKLPETAEHYLRDVRRGLGTLDARERDDVIAELRSHLLERKGQGKNDLLEGFEDAASLARDFVSERALEGALSRGTPWAFVRAILVSAGESLVTLAALVPLVLLQIVAFFSLLTAALKPFSPGDFGLWVGEGQLYVGRRSPTVHEVLGWWGMPVLVVFGVVLFWASSRGLRALARSRLAAHRLRHP